MRLRRSITTGILAGSLGFWGTALADPCPVSLTVTEIVDNGDGDGFADTEETLEIGISAETWCPAARDCVARITTASPAVDCIPQGEISLGDLAPPGQRVSPVERFRVRIGEVDRTALGLDPGDDLSARLAIEVSCADESGASPVPYELELQLDLNAWDLGQTPVDWIEDFESASLGKFEPRNDDAGLPGTNDALGLIYSEGWRCQYSDPDRPGSLTHGRPEATTCYPGITLAQADNVYWRLDGATVADSPDGGRAKSGSHSMYYGIFLDDLQDDFTTPMSVVESVATIDPINLGLDSPRISFWHQVSLADHRLVNGIDAHVSADRGVLQLQVADAAGSPISDWMTLQPVRNPYDSQAVDNFFACMFDPIDDGNNEDDFYDPADPNRQHGPSSTCFPSSTWSWLGDTANPFNTGMIGHATTPPTPADVPSLGLGTWVETVVDLSEFRGRRVRLRFLVSSLKTYFEDWFQQLGDNNEMDDGWWIDDVVVEDTLAQPADFSNDGFLLGSCSGSGDPCIEQCRLTGAPCSATIPCGAGEGDCVAVCPPGENCSGPPPDCGVDCTTAEANLRVGPTELPNPESVSTGAPGEEVLLNATDSTVDACIDGFREYRFCVSGDDDCDDGGDTVLADWSWTATHTVAPEVVTGYAMEVRCSSVPACRDGRSVEVEVGCPGGDPNTLGLREVRALDVSTLVWPGELTVDWMRGSFVRGDDIGDYVADLTDSAPATTSIPMAAIPASGTGHYYLVKRDGPVNLLAIDYLCDSVTWRSGGDAERGEPARNATLGNP